MAVAAANRRGASGAFRNFDVARAANSGSYQKALVLVRDNAVRILIRCEDGAVEASVRSERGNEEYVVRVKPSSGGEVAAKCSCVDHKKRGGLCKHGSAVVLVLQSEAGGASAAPAAACGSPVAGEGATMSPPARRTEMVTPAAKRQRTATTQAAAMKRLFRGGVPPGGSGGSDDLDDIPEPPAATPPPLAQPRFPQEPTAAQGCSGAQSKQRRDTVKAGLIMRMLCSRASAGNEAAFRSELRRWGEGPLDDVAGLLHRALHAESEAGAAAVAAAILARPEGAAAVDAADSAGRAPLHVAVAANRRGLCQLLVEHRADLSHRDASGRTPLELARTRRLDASLHQLEDPIVVYLRQAAESKAGGGAAATAVAATPSAADLQVDSIVDLPIMELLDQASNGLGAGADASAGRGPLSAAGAGGA